MFLEEMFKLNNVQINAPMSMVEFYERQIRDFKNSQALREMLDGEKYYVGVHDILKRKRTVIGNDGKLEEVVNLPNNRIVDNQYKKLVTQKVNYLLGQPVVLYSNNEIYNNILQNIFNKSFQRLIKNIGEDSINCGIGWLYVYINSEGRLAFNRFKPYEIIPGWADTEHTKLDYVIRVYEIVYYEGKQEKIVEKVEIYDKNGIGYYIVENGHLKVDTDRKGENYFIKGKQGYNWSKIPIIAFKYNTKEIPLIKNIKSLQDGLNLLLSNFQNNMEEDIRNTILVLKNYDGENLGEFRKNLATYGAVKVRTVDGADGGVDTLSIQVNSENYKTIIDIFKKTIIENAMGYDAKDDRLAGNPNQMNIQSMYSDIDLDANNMETEYQASLEEVLWFVNAYLFNSGAGNFDNENVTIIFNRDILINESEAIDNCAKSKGIISDETIVQNHPWIDDVAEEMDKIEQQNKANIDTYGLPVNRSEKDEA